MNAPIAIPQEIQQNWPCFLFLGIAIIQSIVFGKISRRKSRAIRELTEQLGKSERERASERRLPGDSGSEQRVTLFVKDELTSAKETIKSLQSKLEAAHQTNSNIQQAHANTLRELMVKFAERMVKINKPQEVVPQIQTATPKPSIYPPDSVIDELGNTADGNCYEGDILDAYAHILDLDPDDYEDWGELADAIKEAINEAAA